MHSNDIKNQFIQLRAKGLSYRTIAENLRISKTVASEWGARFKTEIENQAAVEREAIQEQYLVSFEQEMALLGDEFRRVTAELRQRDYGYESTPALWNRLSALLTRMDKKRVIANPVGSVTPDESEPAPLETPLQP